VEALVFDTDFLGHKLLADAPKTLIPWHIGKIGGHYGTKGIAAEISRKALLIDALARWLGKEEGSKAYIKAAEWTNSKYLKFNISFPDVNSCHKPRAMDEISRFDDDFEKQFQRAIENFIEPLKGGGSNATKFPTENPVPSLKIDSHPPRTYSCPYSGCQGKYSTKQDLDSHMLKCKAFIFKL
jgi:hypothetical protein